ncbi:MAG: acyltransferase [Pseudorhodoplanes sp.]|nr:acyltransferase [Pseudorhodoplanes sp.]
MHGSAGRTTTLLYRADIDGLRALAVGLVVTFHAFPHTMPGGFIGVDVFFVISGFLISGLICGEMRNGQFSVTRFYARRARRIFPALIVTLLAVLAIGWLVLLAAEYKTLGLHVTAGAGFASNLILWSESGYFDVEAVRKPLLHLWSLGVEEQFYLFWPLLLVLGFKLKRPLLLVLLVFSLSFLLNLFQIAAGDTTGAFFSPLTRVWELAAGAITFFVCEAHASQRQNAHTQTACACAGLVLILASAFLLNAAAPFPGWRAAAPVGGTVLLVMAGPNAWPNRVLLSHRAAVRLGLISYPLYLWHWPLLVFAHIENATAADRMPIRAGIVAASIALAWLTYVAIEKPVRSRHATMRLMGILSGLLALVALLGLLVFYRNGVPSRLPEVIRSLGATSYTLDDITREWRYKRCFIYPERDGGTFADDCVTKRAAPLIYLWGDSHAAALYPGLKEVAARTGFGVGQFTTSGCPPLINWVSPHRELCRGINDWNLGNIEKLKPDVIILHADWLVPYYPVDRLGEALAALAAKGFPRLIVVGPSPHWYEPVANVIYREWSKGPRSGTPPLRIPMRDSEKTARIEAQLRDISGKHNAGYFSLIDTLCNSQGCLSRFGDRASDITSYDGTHLTPAAATYVIADMLSVLTKADNQR